MHGVIKAMDGVYPITVIDAVAIGDGTKEMLPSFLNSNYVRTDGVSSEIVEGDTAPVSGAAIFTELEKKVSANGEQGQLPIANGDGTITWTTIQWAEDGEY